MPNNCHNNDDSGLGKTCQSKNRKKEKNRREGCKELELMRVSVCRVWIYDPFMFSGN